MINDNKIKISGKSKRLIKNYCFKHHIEYIVISKKAHKKKMWESIFDEIGWKRKTGDGIIVYKTSIKFK